jgi:branched-chain amino acid aminotransferase
LPSSINFNGQIIPADKPIVAADNRGLRFGDGFFETIRVVDHRICLAGHHFERLYSSLETLQFERPDSLSPENLTEQILSLCRKNKQQHAARVRLTLFRSKGGLYDPENNMPQYIIESWELANPQYELNRNGLITGLFNEGRKACDHFSHIKSNNFLLYAMAALHAKKNHWNDALLLNSRERIAESTIANIFCIKDRVIYTPALFEGCIAGVMRKFIIEKITGSDFELQEGTLSVENIKTADELFVTNAIFGMRWIKQFSNRSYDQAMVQEIFDHIFQDQRQW